MSGEDTLTCGYDSDSLTFVVAWTLLSVGWRGRFTRGWQDWLDSSTREWCGHFDPWGDMDTSVFVITWKLLHFGNVDTSVFGMTWIFRPVGWHRYFGLWGNVDTGLLRYVDTSDFGVTSTLACWVTWTLQSLGWRRHWPVELRGHFRLWGDVDTGLLRYVDTSVFGVTSTLACWGTWTLQTLG